MSKGILKNFFPGGNTCQGFYSLYHHMINVDATRIFCIKGGPGVGKSTFMKFIGNTMLEKGYDVEFHHCSSDNGSIDGVVIPDLQIALLDGTAPHVVDPKNPGAVDEIIHLGDFWKEDYLRKQKEGVLKSNARVSRLFQIAYASLRTSKAFHDELESYITEAQNFTPVNKITLELENDIFDQVKPNFEHASKTRRLFASALTPMGPVNHWETILQGIDRLYTISGDAGTGKSTLINNLATKGNQLGLDLEIYHCAFNPDKIDGVIIPALKTAVINVSIPVAIDVESPDRKTTSVNLDNYLKSPILAVYKDEIALTRNGFWSAYHRAADYIAKAKAEHDVLEEFFIPAMDFEAINQKRDEILNRILKYASE